MRFPPTHAVAHVFTLTHDSPSHDYPIPAGFAWVIAVRGNTEGVALAFQSLLRHRTEPDGPVIEESAADLNVQLNPHEGTFVTSGDVVRVTAEGLGEEASLTISIINVALSPLA